MAGTKGTYTLLLTLESPLERQVGALGTHRFRRGAYAYTGSAFGPGGFARIDRHRRVANGEVATRHWHIDYLLPATAVRAVFTAPGEAIECEVARSLPGERIRGFGSSDCDCDSHLVFHPDQATVREWLERRYGTATEP